ncbi:MAG: hypothetical protein KGY75_01710 [Candidatus Cloacimonetes bacterium]|nr:hypothetical protein [Candidatus Cloacimonadota bacterium]MBS3766827.1 hypothetical protein [Candidatus Cloacimonadota bacterium]
MKKIALVFISLLLLVNFAHGEYMTEEEEEVVTIREDLIPNYSEMSFYYSSKRKEKGSKSQRFWQIKTARLGWKSDYYSIDLEISPLTGSNPMLIKEAYVKLRPFDFMDMYFGKKVYDFNCVSSRAFGNTTIYQPQLFGNSWQVMASKTFSAFTFDIYWADGGTADWQGNDWPSDAGLKFTYNTDMIEAGVSYRARAWADIDDFGWDDLEHEDFGVYAIWNIQDMFKLNAQMYMLDDTDVNTPDMNYFVIASYEKGFMLPFFHKTVPYAGYFSKRDENGDAAKEYNMVAGLHTTPLENAFIKMEYNHDSIEIDDPQTFNEKLSDAFTVSVGYEF